MDFFTEQYKNHNVHNACKDLFESVQNTKLENLSKEEVIAIARLTDALQFLSKLLLISNPYFVSKQTLAAIENHVTKVSIAWNGFCAARDWNVLIAPVTGLLHNISPFPTANVDISGQYGESIKTLRIGVDKFLKQMEKASEEQQNKINTLEPDLEELKEQIESYQAQLEQQKGRVDKIISDHQDTFSNMQNDWKNETFPTFLTELKTLFEDDRKFWKNKFNVFWEEKTLEATDQVTFLTEKKEEAKKLIGIIGRVGVTGNYRRNGDEESRAAKRFQTYALLFFGAMPFIVVGLSVLHTGIIDWGTISFRLTAVLAFLAPALYCANESSKHRKQERVFRTTELELASLNPFLENLKDEEKSQEILAGLAPAYFGNRTDNETEGESTLQTSFDVDKATEFLKALNETLKRFRA